MITLQDAELAFGLTPLLDCAHLTVQPNERIGLIGDSVAKVDSGGKQVADAGQTMREIVDSVKRASNCHFANCSSLAGAKQWY